MHGADTERHRSAGESGTPTGTVPGRGLRGFQKRGFDSCRDVDRHEAISGEQVVLAALVDNTKIPVILGVLVRKDDVDFVAFERGLIAVVLHANSEPVTSRA